jgi:beta-galactosidase
MAAALLAVVAGACTTPLPSESRLRPTLNVRQVDGGLVAYQSGQPVPSFGPQPRERIDLDGSWRFQPAALDPDLSFAPQGDARQRGLIAEAGARLRDDYDDSSWGLISVPGTFSAPPGGRLPGGWYRDQFAVPAGWAGHAALKFQSVGYLTDVWLNGRYLGQHEGAWTPFALDAGDALRLGETNALVVRVDDPEWGTRLDIVPWGLADWWNYGGVTGSVWLEAVPDLSLVRADVAPHLDGADVSVVVQNRGQPAGHLSLVSEVLPAAVTDGNVGDPDPRRLVPDQATPLLSQITDLDPLPGEGVRRVSVPFAIRGSDRWYPDRPALYVLRVALLGPDGVSDELYESFGLRQVKVDSAAPRVLLNGDPAAFRGVAIHDERQTPALSGRPGGGPTSALDDVLDVLQRARQVNADLIRADHHPANPLLLTLADRLGFAVWEEIPLYHYTPETFRIAMDRGVAQQMLAEMALRDMNHPAVLFHGLANESTGGGERTSALSTLRDLDRKLDGTRLVGQAAYGSEPDDRSSRDLDVAGYTLYTGVFYGGALSAAAVGSTLDRLHAAYPQKPVMIMEFGRWADGPQEELEQRRVFEVTFGELASRFDTLPGGFVASAVWWTLDDYWTQRPGLEVEHFGLYRPDGSLRPVGVTAASAFGSTGTGAPRPPPARIVSGGEGVGAGRPGASRQLLGFVLYAVAVPTLAVAGGVLLLGWTDHRRRMRAA